VKKTHSIHAAKTQLSRLIARAEGGEEVIIARRSTPVARLTRVEAKRPARRFGAMRGRAKVTRRSSLRYRRKRSSAGGNHAPAARHANAALVARRRPSASAESAAVNCCGIEHDSRQCDISVGDHHKVALVSDDEVFDDYDVRRFW